MTSNRPYLLRAIYDWICDNGLTPYVLIDATREGVRVPPHVIKDGQVVLNIAMQAVANLDLGNDQISFQARFSGVSQSIVLPIPSVQAIYAQENGQGMMFPVGDDGGAPPPDGTGGDTDGDAGGPTGDGDRPRRGAPHLRVIK